MHGGRGGIGIRTGLKIQRGLTHAGSTPADPIMPDFRKVVIKSSLGAVPRRWDYFDPKEYVSHTWPIMERTEIMILLFDWTWDARLSNS